MNRSSRGPSMGRSFRAPGFVKAAALCCPSTGSSRSELLNPVLDLADMSLEIGIG